MTKPQAQERACQLRAEGMSVKDIAKQLGVAKSSVSTWVREIVLSDDQKAALRDKYHHYDAKIKGSQANYQKGLARRLAYQAEGRAKAREGDPLHLAGCMLYWAEGAKERGSVQLVNSDPDMLVFFTRFLRESLCVPDEKFRVRIICYTNNGLTACEIESYWLTLLQLRQNNLQQTTSNVQPKSSRQQGRKLRHGVCVISIHNVRIVQHIFGAIQEYISIDKPEWLK